MRASIFLVFCVLSCFCAKLAFCEIVGQEETSLISHSCLDISMQVEKACEDVQNVTEKIKAYDVSHELLTTKEECLTATKNSSQYSVAVHIRSLNLMLTLKGTIDNCEKYNRNGKSEYGKILTEKDDIEVSLHYNSSVTYTDHGDADITTTVSRWLVLSFKSLASKMAVVYTFWEEKAMKVFQCIAWPFKILVNNIVAAYDFVTGVCSFLQQKVHDQFDDPIKWIEAVLEVIWMVVNPFIRAVIWLCEIVIDVKRDIKLETELFLEKYPAVLECIATCKMIGENLSELMALWPWNWMDSIEYIGYTWLILYFSFALIKFAMMEERQMIRIARRADRNDKRH